MSNKKHSFSDLLNVIKALRDPDTGCPWDIEQSLSTVRKYAIEEAYELYDAIGSDDNAHIIEELGDYLFQPLFYAQIAQDEGRFSLDDVIDGVTRKMIARHPHVFGDKNAASAADVDVIWEAQKSQEKPISTDKSALSNTPKALPALTYAHKLQKKAAKVGFEWDDISGVLDKLEEELKEVEEAKKTASEDHIKDELGDVLFVLVNYIRMSGFDSEELLRQANRKFETRFRLMEDLMRADKQDINALPLADKEEYWQAAKKQLK